MFKMFNKKTVNNQKTCNFEVHSVQIKDTDTLKKMARIDDMKQESEKSLRQKWETL